LNLNYLNSAHEMAEYIGRNLHYSRMRSTY
jgi:hypothetical protein